MGFDWDDVRVFLEIHRTGRLSHAAKRLGLSHTTVSRRLKMIEERFWKSYTPSGDENRAVPDVGSTWLGPAQ